jgi:glutathione peroxidase
MRHWPAGTVTNAILPGSHFLLLLILVFCRIVSALLLSTTLRAPVVAFPSTNNFTTTVHVDSQAKMAAAAEPEIYTIPVRTTMGKEVPAGEFIKGKVALIVNTASQCGFTGHYAGMQALQDKFADRGFTVLAFPCNQFGGQEPGTDEEISKFVCTKFKGTFPIFSKVDVNGDKAAPLFKYLKASKGGWFGDGIKWNFTKFLVDREGKVIERYAPTTSPESIEKDIEKLLK